jgi:hypothetical protein
MGSQKLIRPFLRPEQISLFPNSSGYDKMSNGSFNPFGLAMYVYTFDVI